MAFFTGDKNSKKVQEAQRVATRAARAQEEEVSRTGKTRATSYWAVSWNIFKRNRLGVFCLIVVGLLVLIALFAPVLAPYDFKAQELSNMLAKPDASHLFGTDEFGRDI